MAADVLSAIKSIFIRVSDGTRPIDRFLAFGLIPTVLLLIGTLPMEIQRSWVLDLDNPSIADLYLSNFVHNGVRHLSNNILSVEMILIVLVALAVFSQRKRELFWISIPVHTLVPIAISLYSLAGLAETSAETVAGYSGIAAAYLGLITVFIGYVIGAESEIPVSPYSIAAGLMGVEIGIIFVIAGAQSLLVLFLLLASLSVLLALFWRQRETLQGMEMATLLLISYSTLLFLVNSYNIVLNVGPGTNVYGHLIGLVGGFFCATLPPQLRSVAQLIGKRRSITENKISR